MCRTGASGVVVCQSIADPHKAFVVDAVKLPHVYKT
jgi:hypothetical protein